MALILKRLYTLRNQFALNIDEIEELENDIGYWKQEIEAKEDLITILKKGNKLIEKEIQELENEKVL